MPSQGWRKEINLSAIGGARVRPPTLYGVPKVLVHPMVDAETCSDQKMKPAPLKLRISRPQEPLVEAPNVSSDGLPTVEVAKEADTVSNGNERRVPVVKIKVKQSLLSDRVEDGDNVMNNSRGGHIETEVGPSSSVSVDAPPRIIDEPMSAGNQNLQEVNSSHDHGSRMTASIGSAKFGNEEEVGKEWQCTADSRRESLAEAEDGKPADTQKHACLQTLSVPRHNGDDGGSLAIGDQDSAAKGKEEKKKSKKEKKRKREEKGDQKGHRDDPEYLERKRLKKEMKKMAKQKQIKLVQTGEAKDSPVELQNMGNMIESQRKESTVESKKLEESSRSKANCGETRGEILEGSSVQKLRIKFKSRKIDNL